MTPEVTLGLTPEVEVEFLPFGWPTGENRTDFDIPDPLFQTVDPEDTETILEEIDFDLTPPVSPIPHGDEMHGPPGGWSAQYERCARAVRAFRMLDLTHIRSDTLQEKAKFRTRVDAYDAACLTDPTVVAPPVPVSGFAGVLTNRRDPFCSGLLLNPQTVATARHCFFGTGGLRTADTDPTRNDIRFTLVGSSDQRGYQVTEIRENDRQRRFIYPSPTNAQHDYLFLKITPDAPAPALPPIASATEPTDQLVVYGVSVPVYLRKVLDIEEHSEDLSDPGVLRSSLRWDRSPKCFVVDTKENCIYHFCQTSGAYSGAPIVRYKKTANSFDIIGIHTSAIAASEECVDSRLGGVGNVGIIPGDDFRAAAAAPNWRAFVNSN